VLAGREWNFDRIHGHFKVSSKKPLADLDRWDAVFADLVRRIVGEANPQQKFATLSAIIDHVSAELGGRQYAREHASSSKLDVNTQVVRPEVRSSFSPRSGLMGIPQRSDARARASHLNACRGSHAG
jgi:hypothetical protein